MTEGVDYVGDWVHDPPLWLNNDTLAFFAVPIWKASLFRL